MDIIFRKEDWARKIGHETTAIWDKATGEKVGEFEFLREHRPDTLTISGGFDDHTTSTGMDLSCFGYATDAKRYIKTLYRMEARERAATIRKHEKSWVRTA